MSVGHCTQREPSLLRQSLFGCSIFVPKPSPPPTRFISCSKRWMLKPQPHDVAVPKRGAIVKKKNKRKKEKSRDTAAACLTLAARKTTRRKLRAAGEAFIRWLFFALLIYWRVATFLRLPGWGYWFYTNSQLMQLARFKKCVAVFILTTARKPKSVFF